MNLTRQQKHMLKMAGIAVVAITIIVLSVFVILFAPPPEPSEVAERSGAVESVSLTVEEDTPYLLLTLADPVRKNDEWCVVTRTGDVTTTQCYDDWFDAQITTVVVEEADDSGWITEYDRIHERTGQSLAGETVKVPISWSGGEYRFTFVGEGKDTYFTAIVEDTGTGLELTTASKDDTY